jgi:hypothetical protein
VEWLWPLLSIHLHWFLFNHSEGHNSRGIPQNKTLVQFHIESELGAPPVPSRTCTPSRSPNREAEASRAHTDDEENAPQRNGFQRTERTLTPFQTRITRSQHCGLPLNLRLIHRSVQTRALTRFSRRSWLWRLQSEVSRAKPPFRASDVAKTGGWVLSFCVCAADLVGLEVWGKTGNIQRKLASGQSRLKQVQGVVVASGSSGMASSPATPTPASMTSRMARPPDRSFDIRAVIKQQDVARDLALPSLTAAQIASCEIALKVLKQKVKGTGGRNVIDREFDTLQVFPLSLPAFRVWSCKSLLWCQIFSEACSTLGHKLWRTFILFYKFPIFYKKIKIFGEISVLNTQAERMQNYMAFSQTTAAVSPINRAKNRYTDVLPCILKVILDLFSGFFAHCLFMIGIVCCSNNLTVTYVYLPYWIKEQYVILL